MIRRRHIPILAALAVLGAQLSVCSGCGSSSSPTVTGKSVFWAAPQSFTDNTPLVPSRDLQGYEIYIRQDSSFEPADNVVATAPPLDTSYRLANVSPPLTQGVIYYVSLRAVTVEGVKSDFSPAVSFSLP